MRAMRSGSVALLCASLALPATRGDAQIAVRGDTVYTMTGTTIADGVVLIDRRGKIEAVGAASRVRVPDGYRVLTAKFVTPGLIDAHTVVGLAGMLNQPHDQDQLETSAPIQPELRAFDAYNAREDLVEYLRNLGITTLHTGHGPGALMSGQMMLVKTRGETISDALIDSVTMVAMTLGPDVSRNFSGRSPGTRAKGIAMIRAELVKAQEYERKRRTSKPENMPARDLKLDVLSRVVTGQLPVLVTAHGVPEILAALRLKQEFGLRMILDGASEAYLVVDEIRAAGVPVILHPTMVRNRGTTSNASLETARKLREAGITVALQSGYEGYVPKTRVVLFEAALTAANGLSREEALAMITIDAARILGVDRRIGSLERGKDGDVVLFDGDPLEYTSRVCGVIIEGQVLSEQCH